MEQKHKLCYIIPEYNVETPTHFSYLYDFARKISEDLDVFLMAERGSGDLGILTSNGYKQKYSRFPLRGFENLWVLYKAYRRGYKDFYVHYSFISAFNAALIVKIFGGRVFYWNCGLPWKYARSYIRDEFERLTYKMITFLVTGTNSLAEEYASYYRMPAGKIKVMPNWINLDALSYQKTEMMVNKIKKELNIEEGAKIILFAHRLSRRKGAHYLPEILKGFRHENVCMIVAGDGLERDSMQMRIENNKLGDKVRFLGWVPQQNLLPYYHMADVFIMPSEEEGFPHVLLEAMASGVPFVANNVGGVKDIVPSVMFNYLIQPRDTMEFVLKIKILLLKSAAEKAELSRRLKEWVKRYDIAKVKDHFIKMIENE